MLIAYGGYYPWPQRLGYEEELSWIEDSFPNLDCNVSVWIVPNTIQPEDYD